MSRTIRLLGPLLALWAACGSSPPPPAGQPASGSAPAAGGAPAAPADPGPPNGVFQLTVKSAKVAPARPDGKPWNSGGGPKPYVIVEVGPARYLSEPVAATEPRWDFRVVVHVDDPAQPTLKLAVWNAGLKPTDVMCQTEVKTTDVLSKGGALDAAMQGSCDRVSLALERLATQDHSGERQHAVGAVDTEPDDGLEIQGITGSLDESELNSTIQSKGGEIRSCYEHSAAGKKGRGGQLMIAFMVDKNGKASDIKPTEDTVGDAGLVDCLAQGIARWRFPRARGGKAAVSFPVQFN